MPEQPHRDPVSQETDFLLLHLRWTIEALTKTELEFLAQRANVPLEEVQKAFNGYYSDEFNAFVRATKGEEG